MDIEKIKNAETNIIGKKIEYYKEINSTHLYGKEIGKDKENNGKILLAEVQTAGIGTKGRKWYTGESKNIAMTIILHPKCNIGKLNHLTIDIAKCMQNTIKELYGYKLEIKEPNDLLLNNKKICGILTEINTTGEKINYLLISLGFNVNEEVFSKDLIDISTSLKKEYGKNFSREEIIVNFIEKLEKEIEL